MIRHFGQHGKDCYSCEHLFATSAEALQTRRPETADTIVNERQLVRDRTAFKQMRDSGVNPGRMHGAEELQRHCETKWEAENAKILPASIRGRAVEAHEAVARGEIAVL